MKCRQSDLDNYFLHLNVLLQLKCVIYMYIKCLYVGIFCAFDHPQHVFLAVVPVHDGKEYMLEIYIKLHVGHLYQIDQIDHS